MTIDWEFLETLEGNRLDGYVPQAAFGAILGHSGVTIAGGIDLGQHAPAELDLWPISPALRARLKPYCGIKGDLATRTLRGAPLTLSEAEALALNAAAQSERLKLLRDRYNDVTRCSPSFDDLPDAAQTILMSVSFQYGDLGHACPVFWRRVVCQAWPEAIAELRDFKDAFPTRRNREADYLESALAGKMVA